MISTIMSKLKDFFLIYEMFLGYLAKAQKKRLLSDDSEIINIYILWGNHNNRDIEHVQPIGWINKQIQ